MEDQAIDFFLFGATSDIAQRLFTDERDHFRKRIRRLILVQRRNEVSPAYSGFETSLVIADAANVRDFQAALADIVHRHATRERKMEVFPTYGVFNTFGDMSKLRFAFSDDGLQINLNSRLQVIDAFKPFHANTRFHLFGSLLGSFPYAGDYALSMWYVNQLPRHPEYKDLDLRIYNLGGMKTGFWEHAKGPKNNPFVHRDIPVRWLRQRMADEHRGTFDCYPTLVSRIAIALARRGARLL